MKEIVDGGIYALEVLGGLPDIVYLAAILGIAIITFGYMMKAWQKTNDQTSDHSQMLSESLDKGNTRYDDLLDKYLLLIDRNAALEAGIAACSADKRATEEVSNVRLRIIQMQKHKIMEMKDELEKINATTTDSDADANTAIDVPSTGGNA